MDLEQKIRKLSEARQQLILEIVTFQRKEYLCFADHSYCLYNVFSCHLLMDQHEEEQDLLEGIILFEKLKAITALLVQAKRQLPIFTAADFWEGKENILVYELDERPRGMRQKDFYEMKNRCIQQKGECVNLEFEKIRERFIESNADHPRLMDQVRSNMQLLDELFQNRTSLTVDQLTVLFSNLSGPVPGSLPDDMDEFHRLFCQFDPRKNLYHALSPGLIRLAREQIREGKISPVPVCYLSLIKFEKWLAAVWAGEIGLNDPPGAHYELLFRDIYENNIDFSKKLMAYFHLTYASKNFSKKKYKSIVWEKLKECRADLNQLKYPVYYHLLLNKENTQNYFIDQCWLDIDIHDHSCQLGKAIVINEMIKFYICKLSQLDPGMVNPTPDIGNIKIHFEEIISAMLPDSEISEQLWNAFNKFSLVASGRKPILFVVEDFKDALRHIFQLAFVHFKKVLDGQPGHIVESYTQNQLNELEQMVLITPEFGGDLIDYLKKLKKLLKIKRKSFSGPQSSRPGNSETPYNDLQTQEIKTENNIIMAFNYNNKKDDNLSLVHETLIHLKAIPDDTKTLEVRGLLNGQECQHPIQWLAGLGDLMVFIKALAGNGKVTFPYQQQWNIAVKCFVQADGSKFNVGVLKSSRPTNNAAKFIKAANQF